jgi:hypothetical protein
MADKRKHPREPARVKARVLVDDKWHDGVITNSSSAGVRLYLRKSVAIGKAVRIQIAEYGQYDTKVVWCGGYETGLKLEHDPAEIAGMLKALAA